KILAQLAPPSAWQKRCVAIRRSASIISLPCFLTNRTGKCSNGSPKPSFLISGKAERGTSGFRSRLALSLGISKVWTESDKGRSPAAGLRGGIMKGLNKRQSHQQRADIFALHSSALAVDQPHHGEAGRPALGQIFRDDTTNFLWSKRVKVKNILQR